MAEGVTTLEVKSGYGLSLEHEARCLRVARRLGAELPLTVRTTCLAAHALPPEFDGRPDEYIDGGLRLAALAARRGPGRRRRCLLRTHRLHAGADAARVRSRAAAGLAGQAARRTAQRPGRRRPRGELRRAVAATTSNGCPATACARWPRAGTVAVLLPGAFYFLRETQLPPVQALRDAGVRDRDRQRPQPGLVAGAVDAADAEHGLHACSGSRPRRRCAAPPSTAPARSAFSDRGVARRRASAPTSPSGRWTTRTSWPTGSATTPAGASSPVARSDA